MVRTEESEERIPQSGSMFSAGTDAILGSMVPRFPVSGVVGSWVTIGLEDLRFPPGHNQQRARAALGPFLRAFPFQSVLALGFYRKFYRKNAGRSSEQHGLRQALDAELLHHAGTVQFHGSGADPQASSDRFVRSASLQALEHLPFAFRHAPDLRPDPRYLLVLSREGSDIGKG